MKMFPRICVYSFVMCLCLTRFASAGEVRLLCKHQYWGTYAKVAFDTERKYVTFEGIGVSEKYCDGCSIVYVDSDNENYTAGTHQFVSAGNNIRIVNKMNDSRSLPPGERNTTVVLIDIDRATGVMVWKVQNYMCHKSTDKENRF